MSRSPSTTGLAIVSVLAAASLAVGAAMAVRPALVLERVPELEAVLSALDPALVVLAMALVLVVFAPTLGIAGRLRSSATSPLVEPTAGSDLDPSRFDDRAARRRIVGESFDRWLEQATAYDDESRSAREDARRRLVESLRPVAATAYANRAGLTEDDAMAAIEAGSWTDDPRAAAFLGGPDGPSTPLWLWLFDLVSAADPVVRSLEHAIDEIERVQSTPSVAAPAAPAGTSASERTETADAEGTA
ncbi:hypothetical protein CP556_09525 [Natrinema sp. CBA1119]|uniref:DUF7269 family protein n=1 Tax=Natrinema sp. CBA1119 TaxID=1608465 RepID=UPI000BF81959|nr:hypothetical protein [Natrinema sp. CBA1119]PGF16330.1 hypothetical protein CP556_09525 [Natrinema sp. CBA1119]